MNQITGAAVVLIGKYTSVDPLNPHGSDAHEFIFVDDSALDESGALTEVWRCDGYTHAGTATIQIDLLPANEITARRVEALKLQKTQVLADAQAQATQIEGQIQSLLAIAN